MRYLSWVLECKRRVKGWVLIPGLVFRVLEPRLVPHTVDNIYSIFSKKMAYWGKQLTGVAPKGNRGSG